MEYLSVLYIYILLSIKIITKKDLLEEIPNEF